MEDLVIEKEIKIRDVDTQIVNQLHKQLISTKSKELKSLITVQKLETEDSHPIYQVVDGNHRLEAMQQIRKTDLSYFAEVKCLVYNNLTARQAWILAYDCNAIASSVNKMTIQDKVKLVRKLSMTSSSKNDTQFYNEVYSALNINPRDVCTPTTYNLHVVILKLQCFEN